MEMYRPSVRSEIINSTYTEALRGCCHSKDKNSNEKPLFVQSSLSIFYFTGKVQFERCEKSRFHDIYPL